MICHLYVCKSTQVFHRKITNSYIITRYMQDITKQWPFTLKSFECNCKVFHLPHSLCNYVLWSKLIQIHRMNLRQIYILCFIVQSTHNTLQNLVQINRFASIRVLPWQTGTTYLNSYRIFSAWPTSHGTVGIFIPHPKYSSDWYGYLFMP